MNIFSSQLSQDFKSIPIDEEEAITIVLEGKKYIKEGNIIRKNLRELIKKL